VDGKIMTFSSDLESMLADFDVIVRGGKNLSDAASMVRRLARITLEESIQLRDEYERRNSAFIVMTDPKILKENQAIESWYAGPDFDGAWCWPPLKQVLSAPEGGWLESDFKSLDTASTGIVAHLPHPNTSNFNHRGLVVGYVQSGKTANFAAVIAKAADIGYRLIIILSGTTSSLRRQTQARMQADVVSHNPANWTWITGPNSDFAGNTAVADALIDVQSHRKRVIAVVKKNVKILDRIIEWVSSASQDTLTGCPALIIDDEADSASVNTNKPELDPTKINDRIRQLLAKIKKVAYIGYTATPFANIFINPTISKDLFPRNFILALDKPAAYFGPEKIFGIDVLSFDLEGVNPDGLDIVRTISSENPDERAMLSPSKAGDRFAFNPELPASLKVAIRYFVLSTAARHARGQDGKHSSMLVHTTMYVDLHDKIQAKLLSEINNIKYNLGEERSELESLWKSEDRSRLNSSTSPSTTFEDIWRNISFVLDRLEVVVDNGRVSSTLIYEKDRPRVVIAVGGNTFSRGLTLEGLVVSYYLRSAKAYDTLLQMGRWFGFRPQYEDLPRIWMTDELQGQFQFLAGIEEEIRQDIRRLQKEQKSPMDLAIRIRTHPKMAITSRSKMLSARLTSASYSDRTVQSFLFNHEDTTWLQNNIDATRELGLKISNIVNQAKSSGQYLARNIDVKDILEFLEKYKFHKNHDDLDRELLTRYIKTENSKGALKRWNVAWIGQATANPELGTLDVGLAAPLNCLNRSRFRTTVPCNIKALMSIADRGVDLNDVVNNAKANDYITSRNLDANRDALLLVYPISKDSAPLGGPKTKFGLCGTCHQHHFIPLVGSTVRHPLGAALPIVGVGLVFPGSTTDQSEYVANEFVSLFEADPVEEGEVTESDEEGDEG